MAATGERHVRARGEKRTPPTEIFIHATDKNLFNNMSITKFIYDNCPLPS